MKILRYLLFFIISINYVFADREARSNHSYQALGFTRLPEVKFSVYMDGMIIKTIQEKKYSEELIKNVYVLNSNYGEDVDNIKNKQSSSIPVYLSMDSTLTAEVMGINDFGLKYGALIDFNANTTKSSYNRTLNANGAFLYGEFIFGKIEFGSVKGASSKLKIGAETLTKGERGGINGRYLSFVNLPSIGVTTAVGRSSNSPLFILVPQHPTGHSGFGIGFNNIVYWCEDENGKIDTNCAKNYINNNGWNGTWTPELGRMENSLKISYYTSEIYGFQAGVSFTPDTGNLGAGSWTSSSLDSGDINNLLEYGITYTGGYYGVGFSAGFTGQMGTSETKKIIGNKYIPQRNKLNSMQFGAVLTFYGLSIGGSLGRWGNSLQYIKTAQNYVENYTGEYMTVGLSYEFGPLYLSGTMLESKFQNNKYSAISFNIDYKLSKSFYPYIELTQFNFTPDAIKYNQVSKNNGIVVIAGFVLTF